MPYYSRPDVCRLQMLNMEISAALDSFKSIIILVILLAIVAMILMNIGGAKTAFPGWSK